MFKNIHSSQLKGIRMKDIKNIKESFYKLSDNSQKEKPEFTKQEIDEAIKFVSGNIKMRAVLLPEIESALRRQDIHELRKILDDIKFYQKFSHVDSIIVLIIMCSFLSFLVFVMLK